MTDAYASLLVCLPTLFCLSSNTLFVCGPTGFLLSVLVPKLTILFATNPRTFGSANNLNADTITPPYSRLLILSAILINSGLANFCALLFIIFSAN